MKDRIKQIRKDAGLSQQKFANEVGVSLSNIESYEMGRRNPSDAFIQLLVNKYHVREEWLRTGAGDMYAPKDRTTEIAEIVATLHKDDNPLRTKLVSLICQVDEVTISDAVQKLMDALNEENHPE